MTFDIFITPYSAALLKHQQVREFSFLHLVEKDTWKMVLGTKLIRQLIGEQHGEINTEYLLVLRPLLDAESV